MTIPHQVKSLAKQIYAGLVADYLRDDLTEFNETHLRRMATSSVRSAAVFYEAVYLDDSTEEEEQKL